MSRRAPDPEVFRHGAAADANRRGKAIDLAKHAYSTGRPLPTDPAARRAAERAAGVRRSSDETWDLAVVLLAERLVWDRKHAEPGERFCEQVIGTAVCSRPGARQYLTGLCCPAHTPAATRGRPETVPDPTRTLTALRVAAGRNPDETAPATATGLNDDRAIRKGKRRSSPHRYAEARQRWETR